MVARCKCPSFWQSAVLVLLAGVCVTLQGCGSGSTPTPSPTPSGPSTTMTTTTTFQCNTPMDGNELAKMMNKQFYSFDETDPNSGQGVYLRSAEDPTIYCGGPCFPPGVADCRISGSMYNSKQMLEKKDGKATIAFGFGKRAAWYVNMTQLATRLGKCSYVWDGGTNGKYNNGCGCNPGKDGCTGVNANKNPWANMDKDTNYTKKNTGSSNDVKSCACANKAESSWPKTWGYGPVCFWKGPAYYVPDGYVKDDTWDMLKWRVDHQDYMNGGIDQGKDPVAFWNEIVVDGVELLKSLKEDYVSAMPAIVYDRNAAGGRDVAKSMASFIAKNYGGACDPLPPVPTIALDQTIDTTNGADIFFYEPEAQQGYPHHTLAEYVEGKGKLAPIDVVRSDQTKTAAPTDQDSTNWLGLIAMLIVLGTVGFFAAVGVMMKKKQAQKREAQIGTNIEMLQGQVDL